MLTPRAVWAVLLAVAVLVERYGMRHPGQGWTLSELTRWALRTETPTGRYLLHAALVGFVSWYLPHVSRGVAEGVRDDAR